MLSAQRRFEDAQDHLQVTTEAERRALAEEMDSWYFSSNGGQAAIQDDCHTAMMAVALAGRPDFSVLEEAAAAVKAKVAAAAANDLEWLHPAAPLSLAR